MEETKICLQCGQEFSRPKNRSHPTFARQKYCSYPCQYASKRLRFDDFVHPTTPDECWEWQGAMASNGYGRLGTQYAHRVSYERSAGRIPDGFHIDHLCRNTRCVNPAHLEAVPPRINMLRGESPGAQVRRSGKCLRGHELSPENTYVHLTNGWQDCRTCKNARDRARRAADRKASR